MNFKVKEGATREGEKFVATTDERGTQNNVQIAPPYEVPPFQPPKPKPVWYAWWIWHPIYPRWTKSCWGSESLEKAREYIITKDYELDIYHNKLIKEDNGTFEEIEDVPCKRVDVWWKIKEKQNATRVSS